MRLRWKNSGMLKGAEAAARLRALAAALETRVACQVLLDPGRRRHDEPAVGPAGRQALDLGRDQRQAEALLAPPRRVAGVHDADREVALAAVAQPRVGLEGVGVVVDEEVVLVGRRMRLGEDVDERPPREGEVDGAGRQPLDGFADPHPALEDSGVGLPDGVGDVVEQVARHAPRLLPALVLVEGRDEVEELHRHRGGADEHVALARDGDRALLWGSRGGHGSSARR